MVPSGSAEPDAVDRHGEAGRRVVKAAFGAVLVDVDASATWSFVPPWLSVTVSATV